MKRMIIRVFGVSIAATGMLLIGCDTKAGSSATPPKGSFSVPTQGPAGGANPGTGNKSSVAPQVLPPPPSK